MQATRTRISSGTRRSVIEYGLTFLLIPCCCSALCFLAPSGRRCRSTSPAHRAHSSKPPHAAAAVDEWDRQAYTDGHRNVTQTLPHTTRTVSVTGSDRRAVAHLSGAGCSRPRRRAGRARSGRGRWRRDAVGAPWRTRLQQPCYGHWSVVMTRRRRRPC